VTLYFVLKYLHVIGASVLLGTGAGIAFFMLMAHLSGNVAGIAAVARIVVIADFVFTATAVVAQPVTGVALAYTAGYPLSEGWIVLSIILYMVTGLFWLPVVWMQMELQTARGGRCLIRKAAAAALSPAVLAVVRLWLSCFRRRRRDLLADDRKARTGLVPYGLTRGRCVFTFCR
jgi:uncharacterized membrane protein